ncbi:hypothetical protein FOA52_011802 [Chlamydomonas sp. UWO 241]|nr:hypothetical protein FOA52_011802 [Chlamydomonas sp. UWO 241]
MLSPCRGAASSNRNSSSNSSSGGSITAVYTRAWPRCCCASSQRGGPAGPSSAVPTSTRNSHPRSCAPPPPRCPPAAAAGVNGPSCSSGGTAGGSYGRHPHTHAHSGGSASTLALQDLIEWDIVEYCIQAEGAGDEGGGGGRGAEGAVVVRLGKVETISDSSVELEPLVEEEDGVWVADASSPSRVRVPGGSLLRVVDADYGQRQDKVGPGNPHGEHAHEVWQVKVPLPPGIYKGR